jgi:hypothetical protein
VEAVSLGRGGIMAVSEASGLARITIGRGVLRGLDSGHTLASDRQRGPGDRRMRADESEPGLLNTLQTLAEPNSQGDPQSPLRWTCKSTRRLACELTAQG